jgi:hypothetical protein
MTHTPTFRRLIIAGIILFFSSNSCFSQLNYEKSFDTLFRARKLLQDQPDTFRGWWLPNTGNLTGNFDASVGIHFWSEHFWFRNLQFRSQLNVFKGLRLNSVVRSNHNLYKINTFEPFFDELYAEFYGYRLGSQTTFSFSARAGRIRYMRTPFPDFISIFDIVPGIADLTSPPRPKTAFEGFMVSLDYKLYQGLGLHTTILGEQPENSGQVRMLEGYAFYKRTFGLIDLEARCGMLHQHLDMGGYGCDFGANLYAGIRIKNVRAGGLIEKLEGKTWCGGILVQFSPSLITNILGTVHFDYTRNKEGFAAQIPLVKGNFGYADEKEVNGTLVGEMVAERRMTFWRNSQTRNFYEHQYSLAGQVEGDSIVAVIDEFSWYLKNESPVGPLYELNSADDVLEWDSNSARLGEIAQPVVYRFYKYSGAKPKKKIKLKPGIEVKNLGRKYRYK